MSTTVQAKITEIAGMYNHSYSDATLLGWINKVEEMAFTEYVDKWLKNTLSIVAGTAAYNYPASVTIDDIYYVLNYDDNKYYKVDCRTDTDIDDTYYYNFYDESSQIKFSPTPTLTGTLVLPYRYKPTTKLIANISTDVLLIADAYNDVYEYYCIYRMKELNQEDDAANWYDRFVVRMQQWADFYKSQLPFSELSQVESYN